MAELPLIIRGSSAISFSKIRRFPSLPCGKFGFIVDSYGNQYKLSILPVFSFTVITKKYCVNSAFRCWIYTCRNRVFYNIH